MSLVKLEICFDCVNLIEEDAIHRIVHEMLKCPTKRAQLCRLLALMTDHNYVLHGDEKEIANHVA